MRLYVDDEDEVGDEDDDDDDDGWSDDGSFAEWEWARGVRVKFYVQTNNHSMAVFVISVFLLFCCFRFVSY